MSKPKVWTVESHLDADQTRPEFPPTGARLAEITRRAHERAKNAKPNLDEKRLRDWMAWKKLIALIGKERPND